MLENSHIPRQAHKVSFGLAPNDQHRMLTTGQWTYFVGMCSAFECPLQPDTSSKSCAATLSILPIANWQWPPSIKPDSKSYSIHTKNNRFVTPLPYSIHSPDYTECPELHIHAPTENITEVNMDINRYVLAAAWHVV